LQSQEVERSLISELSALCDHHRAEKTVAADERDVRAVFEIVMNEKLHIRQTKEGSIAPTRLADWKELPGKADSETTGAPI